MYDIHIILTSRCNLRCAHCGGNCSDVGGTMTVQTVSNILDFLATHKNELGRYVLILGGEPFLCYDLLKLLCYGISMLGYLPSIDTNGTWLKEESFSKQVVNDFKNVPTQLIITAGDYYTSFKNIEELNSLLYRIESPYLSVNTRTISLGDIYPVGRGRDHSNVRRAKEVTRCLKDETLVINFDGRISGRCIGSSWTDTLISKNTNIIEAHNKVKEEVYRRTGTKNPRKEDCKICSGGSYGN